MSAIRNSTAELATRASLREACAQFFICERPVLGVVSACLLPWIVAVFVISGWLAALTMIGYVLLMFAVGLGVIGIALPASVRPGALFLVPSIGIVASSGAAGIWLRLGLPLWGVCGIWLAFALIGLPVMWTDGRAIKEKHAAYGASLAMLSVLVCCVFFFPSARRDAVYLKDGSFNWIYVDTQYFHSVVADIASGNRPPRSPGASSVELRYHFAPYAAAAVVATTTKIDIGTAFARVTRGSSIFALLLSVFGLGELLSLKSNGGRFGAIASVAGLFFYGSLASLFTDSYNSSGHVTGTVLFRIPEVDVLADGGPFSHIILGHSVLHGLVALTAVIGFSLMLDAVYARRVVQSAVLIALPALAVSINSVAALYCLGAAGILVFWKRRDQWTSYLVVFLMCAVFYAAWRVMGYGQAPDLKEASLNRHPYWLWWNLAVEFTIGFGIRLVGFRGIRKWKEDSLAFLLAAGTLGLLAFYLLLQIAGNERYGIYYLQALFSIFAFSGLEVDWLRETKRVGLVREWLRIAIAVMGFFAVSGIVFGLGAFVTHHQTQIYFFRTKLLVCIFALVVAVAVSGLMRRNARFASMASWVVTCILLVGFLGWITPWLNYGMGRAKRDVTIPSAEVQGLARLHEISGAGELFATNRHAVDSLVSNRERSYSYSALSQRPVLLEGYLDHGIVDLPNFQTLLNQNDSMFTTTDPDTLRRLTAAYGVRWLVARPGTDISLPEPLPKWIVPEQNAGDLKIYRIDQTQ